MLKEHNELLVRQAKLHQAKLQDLLRSYQSRSKYVCKLNLKINYFCVKLIIIEVQTFY